MKNTRCRRWIAVPAVAAVCIAGVVSATAAQAATGCRVDYAVTNQWQGGFGANVTVTNLGDAVSSWRLTWTFSAGQTVTQAWSTSLTQSGSAVSASNASYNGALGTGASTQFGFNGSLTGSNPVPTSFALNGTACNG